MSESGRCWTICEGPIGPLTLAAGPRGLTDLRFPGRMQLPDEAAKRPMPEVSEQLDEATAIAAGHRPCAVCMPAEYALWKSTGR